MRLKFKLLILIQIIFLSSPLSAQWKKIVIDSVDGTINFMSTSFVSEKTGFVSGCDGFSAWSTGVILKTSDGGKTWTNLHHPIGNCAAPVAFVSEKVGYNGGQSFMKTIDGGETWATPDNSIPGIITPSVVYFINDSIGFRDDGKLNIAKTTDGGETWDLRPIHQSITLASLFFTSPLNGYAVGYDNPALLKTINGGDSWDTVSTMFPLLAIHFPSKEVGYAVGFNSTIIKTTDEGKNWFKQDANISPSIPIRSVYCLDNTTCYAVADSGIILVTTNGGLKWDVEPSGTTKKLNNIHCTKKGICYIVGDSGIFLKKENGMVGVKELKENKKKDELIIYPNPSSSEVTFKYEGLGTDIYIIILDMLGKIINTIPLSDITTIETYSYDEGIYLCQLYSKGELIGTKKIVVVR